MEQARNDLLEFWFGSLDDDAAAARQKADLWWGKDPETDEQLASLYGHLVSAAEGGVLDHWTGSPRGRLALILLLDQLPRAIHRDTPRAFAGDPKALRVARQGLASDADRLLRPVERVFFYMPFEHSEELEDQEQSVRLFSELAGSVREAWRDTFEGFLDYAVRHRDIVARFGRFPHRNEILDRQSTPEELEFLKEDGSRF